MNAFTLDQLSRASGLSRNAVRPSLPPPSTVKIVKGNETAAWRLADLPGALLSDLAAIAAKRHFRDVESLLADPPAQLPPPCLISQAPQEAVEYAGKLRAVLAPFLETKDANTRSQTQFEADGIAAYQRVFGHPIKGRWFRQLFSRTVRRDNGVNDFTPLELYLPDNIAGRPTRRRPVQSQYNHAALGERLKFMNPARASLVERCNALEYSFRHFKELTEIFPGGEAEITASIRRFIWAAAGPAIARTQGALKRTWNRQFAQWKAGGMTPSGIADQRPMSSGNFSLVDLEPDLKLIVQEAFFHDGKLAIAIRKLRKAGKLSQTFTARYTLDVRRNKSYIAKSIRQEITARLEGMLDYRRSKWAVNMEGPRIQRDWSGVNPGDFFAADDVTFNIVWWFIDDNGRPAVARGEILVFFDCRSLYPLGYIMVPGHYNGETIRRGILHVHDRHGLPHRAWVFEKGAWESRLLLPNQPKDFLGWNEYEMGLRERGMAVELRNVTTPGAKVIEGIFNILQQNQRNERGFVGFNEREYGQEKLQTFIGRVKRGLVHPSKEFHSQDEWREALDRSLEAYLHEPQNGQMLQGQSPAEMFARCKPLRKLPDDARFLLASHRVQTKVKTNGLAITIRGKRRFYYNEALGPYVGRNVYAWFNVEQPDLLTVSDLDMKTFFSVKHKCVPAFDATNEQLAEINRDRAAFMRPAKQRFDEIQHPVRSHVIRDNVIDEDAQALGNHIRRETEQFEHDQGEHKRKLARVVREAESAGRTLPPDIGDPDRVLEALRDNDALRHESGPAADHVPAPCGQHAGDKKYYVLHSAGVAPSPGLYWSLWKQIERIKGPSAPLRHALTHKMLGCHPLPNSMTAAQLGKMIDCFRGLLRDSVKPATA